MALVLTRSLAQQRPLLEARTCDGQFRLVPNAPSEVLGEEFQDLRALAIDAHSRPWFLRLCFRLNRLGYRFVEQDLHRFLSCQHALFDQRAMERDCRADGCHVVSRIGECVHRQLIKEG